MIDIELHDFIYRFRGWDIHLKNTTENRLGHITPMLKNYWYYEYDNNSVPMLRFEPLPDRVKEYLTLKSL